MRTVLLTALTGVITIVLSSPAWAGPEELVQCILAHWTQCL